MNCLSSRIGELLVAAGLLITTQACVRGDTTFDFNSVAVGTATPFSMTVNGVTATFYTPGVPGAFQVGSPVLFAPPINGNVLYDFGLADSHAPLYISFSQNLSRISMDFATDGLGSFGLTPFEGTPEYVICCGLIGSSGTIPTGFSFPQGTISLLTTDSTPWSLRRLPRPISPSKT